MRRLAVLCALVSGCCGGGGREQCATRARPYGRAAWLRSLAPNVCERDERRDWLPSCHDGLPERRRLGELNLTDPVHLVGADVLQARLKNATGRGFRQEFMLLHFYKARCPFSATIERTLREVAAALPLCTLAIDGGQHSRSTTQFAVRGFPTLLLLRDGAVHAVLPHKDSMTLISRLSNLTGLVPDEAAAERWRSAALPELYSGTVNEWADPEPDRVLWASVTVCSMALLQALRLLIKTARL